MAVILGIEVRTDLLAAWCGWLAPDPQPFLVGDDDRWSAIDGDRGTVTPELRDTYRLWAGGAAAGSRVLWLSEDRFQNLRRATRARLVREQVNRRRGAVPSVRAWRDLLDPTHLRGQADGHRFVWWPSLVDVDHVTILRRVISADRLPSRHAEVAASTWRDCEAILPAARTLAGSYPAGSDANCFSTVMAAAGADTTGAYDSVVPFENWLAGACRPGGDPERPGKVLVWRDRDGAPVHAAAVIGDGWGLEKPSQEWHSPRAVVTVADIIRTSRVAGNRLERHTVQP